MKYLLIVLLIKGCTNHVETQFIGHYETRVLCENQKDTLNKYHNTEHFLCVVEDK